MVITGVHVTNLSCTHHPPMLQRPAQTQDEIVFKEQAGGGFEKSPTLLNRCVLTWGGWEGQGRREKVRERERKREEKREIDLSGWEREGERESPTVLSRCAWIDIRIYTHTLIHICAMTLNYMCTVTHSFVSAKRGTAVTMRLVDMYNMTHSYLHCDSFPVCQRDIVQHRASWGSLMRVTWRIHSCGMTHSDVYQRDVVQHQRRYDLLMRVTWHIHTRAVTHSDLYQQDVVQHRRRCDLLIRVTWRIHTCAVTHFCVAARYSIDDDVSHWCVWNDVCIRVPPPIPICQRDMVRNRRRCHHAMGESIQGRLSEVWWFHRDAHACVCASFWRFWQAAYHGMFCLCVPVRISIFMCVSACVCVCESIHMCIYIYIHMLVYICIHIYKYICVCI